ncbi:hypothetical protein AB0M86_22505, partial [Streptomyces sp. NPDC051639]
AATGRSSRGGGSRPRPWTGALTGEDPRHLPQALDRARRARRARRTRRVMLRNIGLSLAVIVGPAAVAGVITVHEVAGGIVIVAIGVRAGRRAPPRGPRPHRNRPGPSPDR